jgi:hypothetical protein
MTKYRITVKRILLIVILKIIKCCKDHIYKCFVIYILTIDENTNGPNSKFCIKLENVIDPENNTFNKPGKIFVIFQFYTVILTFIIITHHYYYIHFN